MPPKRHFSLYWRIKSAFGMWYNSIMGWRHAAAARNLSEQVFELLTRHAVTPCHLTDVLEDMAAVS